MPLASTSAGGNVTNEIQDERRGDELKRMAKKGVTWTTDNSVYTFHAFHVFAYTFIQFLSMT